LVIVETGLTRPAIRIVESQNVPRPCRISFILFRRSASLRAGLRRKEGILPFTVPSIYEPAQAQSPALAQHAGLLSAAPYRGWFLARLDVTPFSSSSVGRRLHKAAQNGLRRFIRRSANSFEILITATNPACRQVVSNKEVHRSQEPVHRLWNRPSRECREALFRE